MPAWPGGPCPTCGDDMPANVIHCRTCRALLNPELERDSVEIPQFVPLPEVDSMADVAVEGYYIDCPKCRRELKISAKYENERVLCKYCSGDFRLDLAHPSLKNYQVYSKCPHCQEQLRIAPKYVGQLVACRFCNGKLRAVEPTA
jgi:hypothetical protein